jgi:hypothetical protein
MTRSAGDTPLSARQVEDDGTIGLQQGITVGNDRLLTRLFTVHGAPRFDVARELCQSARKNQEANRVRKVRRG